MWQQLLAEGIRDTVNIGKEYLYNRQARREYLKDRGNEIQTRVADAKAAGIHPLAALGASLYSPAPAKIANAEMGTNFSRALSSTMNPSDRRLNQRLKEAQVAKAEGEAQLTLDAVKDNQDNTSTPVPSVVEQPALQTKPYSAADRDRGIEAGHARELKWNYGADGGYFSTFSNDLKQLVEDSPDETILSVKRLWKSFLNDPKYKPPISLVLKHYPKANGSAWSWKTFSFQPTYPPNKMKKSHATFDKPPKPRYKSQNWNDHR